MQNVLGGMASKGLGWLFDQHGSWLYDWIYGGISKFADNVLSLTTNATSVFWDVPAIEVCLDFFGWVNGIVLVVSLLLLCMEITEQSGRVNWAIVFSNCCKGFIFVFFNRYIGLATFTITEHATKAIGVNLKSPSSAFISSAVSKLTAGATSAIFLILMTLAILAAFIAFFIMAMLRNGTLLVQIFSSSFYIPSIIRGDTAKLGDWLEQTVAISVTFFIQYLLFCIGLDHLSSFSGDGLVTTTTCWLTMFFVPRILAKFGYSSGTASVLSAAGNAVNSGMAFVK